MITACEPIGAIVHSDTTSTLCWLVAGCTSPRCWSERLQMHAAVLLSRWACNSDSKNEDPFGCSRGSGRFGRDLQAPARISCNSSCSRRPLSRKGESSVVSERWVPAQHTLTVVISRPHLGSLRSFDPLDHGAVAPRRIPRLQLTANICSCCRRRPMVLLIVMAMVMLSTRARRRA
ncbi:hypothetical protein BU16DRAFT_529050 [Lophium mytilinum]|uniref:Uncharacterized protein n=1 Tax=Lophium mytilinum TaxID=390894 RepID=A0A6A6QL33_9PEZI|nr:hypothetical protein BU16DRAFT_529050 [Lophium mytilinum]